MSTGVDMSRMKLNGNIDGTGSPALHFVSDCWLLSTDRSKSFKLSRLLNLASHLPGKRLLGLAPERRLPRWAGQAWRDQELKSVVPPSKSGAEQGSIEITADSTKPQVALFVDTFSRWFEPEIPRAARDLLEASGADVIPLRSGPGERPLCVDVRISAQV